MTHAFDQDIAVRPVSPGRYAATVSERWNIGSVPNGGYLLAVAANALRAQVDHPDPFSVTGHFFRPVEPGPLDIDVATLKVGRGLSYARAELTQGGIERLSVTAVFGDLDKRDGPDHIASPAPEIPGPDGCRAATIPLTFFDNFEALFTPESGRWLDGEHDRHCELEGWARFADGREPDTLSLLLSADGFPPPVLRMVGPLGWVPTVEMTVQVRNRPAPGPLQCRFGCRYITGGYTEEDGELWDSSGRIVAVSRQLAAVRVPGDRGTG